MDLESHGSNVVATGGESGAVLTPEQVSTIISERIEGAFYYGATPTPLPPGFIVPERGEVNDAYRRDFDKEAAHEMEDRVYLAVLQAIADGRCDDPASLARTSLTASAVGFVR